MNLKGVDLNLFVVFEAIYAESSLSGAAKRLCVTQPSVSNALTRLQTTFGDPLFIRDGRGMSPTPAARAIIGSIRSALGLMVDSLQHTNSFSPASADNVFRISMGDLPESLLATELIQYLRLHAPGTRLEIYKAPRSKVVKELRSGRLDLVIDTPWINDEELCCRKIIEQSHVCVVRQDHPVVKDKLTLEDYLALSHVLVSTRQTGPGYVDLALSKLGLERRIAVRIQHYLIVPDLIRSTDLAVTTTRAFSEASNLKILPLPIKAPAAELYLYWHKNADQDKANQWLRHIALELSARLN